MRGGRKIITSRWVSGADSGPIYDRSNRRIHLARPFCGRPIGELTVLNKFWSPGNGEAQVQYLDGDFRVVSPGTYVRCAITTCGFRSTS